MTLLLLVGFVSFCGAFVSSEIHEREKEYYILFLALTSGISGTFCTLDLFFFYFFYEMAVIPMYLLIGVWGSLPPGKHGRTKEYATMKLTLYLTAGAVLALIGLLAIYSISGTTDIEKLQHNWVATNTQMWVFPCLLFGFGFLASMWPFHTWSPLGYAAAPTAASMMHAGVLKKLGAYGIIRLALPLLPEGARHWANLLAVLACFNILYAGWVALTQKDWKFVIGYSSVSHMGYIFLGIAALNVVGVSGAVLLMFAHGIMAALTFGLIGFFYHQTHNRFVPDLSSPEPDLAVVLYTLPGFVVGSVIHELSHAAMALRSGDPTPRRDRRMTFSIRVATSMRSAPAAMLIAGFGWGRPVALDPLYLRDPRRRAAVAAVGPLAHVVVAAIFALALRVELTGTTIDPSGFDILAQFTLEGVLFGVLLQGFLVNIALFVFNALPLPGLDGYAVVRSLLFGRFPKCFLYLEQYRYMVYAAVALAALIPLQVTGGAVNPIASMTIGLASLTFEHLIVPGVTPIFIGLPNVFTLFS